MREAAGPEAAEIRFRGTGFTPGRRRFAALIFFALLLAVWQAAEALRLVDPLFLPSPVAIGAALGKLAASGALVEHLRASLFRIALGWTLGIVVGLAFGVAIGLFTLARSIGVPLISALFPIPKIALLPLFILWLGIGEPSKVATIALGVFFPTAINAYGGVDAVPRNLIRMAQSFDLPWRSIVLKIVLPGALPGILAGLRISTSIALILLVAAEMIGAEKGVGALILQAGHLMQTDLLLAGVVVLSCLGLLIGTALGALERRLLRWR